MTCFVRYVVVGGVIQAVSYPSTPPIQLLEKNPNDRPGWDAIKSHPWFNGMCVLLVLASSFISSHVCSDWETVPPREPPPVPLMITLESLPPVRCPVHFCFSYHTYVCASRVPTTFVASSLANRTPPSPHPTHTSGIHPPTTSDSLTPPPSSTPARPIGPPLHPCWRASGGPSRRPGTRSRCAPVCPPRRTFRRRARSRVSACSTGPFMGASDGIMMTAMTTTTLRCAPPSHRT